MEYITTTQPDTRARCVTKTGWYQNVFVLPDHTIGETHEPVIYQADNLTNPYQTSGTLADWQHHIAAYCAGNSRLVLAVSCAFCSDFIASRRCRIRRIAFCRRIQHRQNDGVKSRGFSVWCTGLFTTLARHYQWHGITGRIKIGYVTGIR